MSSDDIGRDPFVLHTIRRMVQKMKCRQPFSRQEKQDLEQELFAAALRGLQRFEASSEDHHRAFVTTVIKRAVGMMVRRSRAKKRDGGVVHSLDDLRGGPHETSFEPLDSRSGAQIHRDLTRDLAEVLAVQPEQLAALASLLMTHTLSEAARHMGVARSTLQRWVERLRQSFEDAGLEIYLD